MPFGLPRVSRLRKPNSWEERVKGRVQGSECGTQGDGPGAQSPTWEVTPLWGDAQRCGSSAQLGTTSSRAESVADRGALRAEEERRNGHGGDGGVRAVAGIPPQHTTRQIRTS